MPWTCELLRTTDSPADKRVDQQYDVRDQLPIWAQTSRFSRPGAAAAAFPGFNSTIKKTASRVPNTAS